LGGIRRVISAIFGGLRGFAGFTGGAVFTSSTAEVDSAGISSVFSFFGRPFFRGGGGAGSICSAFSSFLGVFRRRVMWNRRIAHEGDIKARRVARTYVLAKGMARILRRGREMEKWLRW